jgi:hypothetical protein
VRLCVLVDRCQLGIGIVEIVHIVLTTRLHGGNGGRNQFANEFRSLAIDPIDSTHRWKLTPNTAWRMNDDSGPDSVEMTSDVGRSSKPRPTD